MLVYKDKYVDYKNKVKAANQQINLLTQRVARYEIEIGNVAPNAMENEMEEDSYGGENNEWKKYSRTLFDAV